MLKQGLLQGAGPKNILLLKSHSMGVGDLLRSSAAWAALKARWPSVRLHFCMLSNHEGYVAQELIGSHHLLSSVHFITAKSGKPGGKPQHNIPLKELMSRISRSLGDQPLDLVIDCEMAGIRTSLISRRIAKLKSAVSVGVAQFPLRSIFYDISAPSSRAYQQTNGLSKPMDYTERDFVALAALGIERSGIPINLRLSPKGLAWKQGAGLHAVPGRKLVVLNIGCGTADALIKRPAMPELLASFMALCEAIPLDIHLIGAAFEKDVNTAFIQQLSENLAQRKLACGLKNWAGQLSIEESAALLDCADLVVSSDSGPYHMAVALGVPTLCWFNFQNPSAVHLQTKVNCMIRPSAQEFCASSIALLSFGLGE
jgi:ADP-heptose:LPS heptosyltransferase